MLDTRMKLDKERNRLIIEYVVTICEHCRQYMIPTYGDAHYLPKHLVNTARTINIKEEHHRIDDVCTECVATGGYKETCEICSGEFSYPVEFAFELQHYPKYPEDETSYEYICKQCCMTRSQLTINALIKADVAKDVR